MRESVTYQLILEEGREAGLQEGLQLGRAEGRQEGRVEGERRLLLLLGTAKLGEPSQAVRQHVEALADLQELDRLAQRLLTATSWDELLATPES